MSLARRNRRTAALGVLVIAVMIGLTAASVPLYRLFCQVTGYGGTPRIEAELPKSTADVDVTVLFDGGVGEGLPWQFHPVQRSLTVHPGEETLAFFEAVNRSDHAVVGQALYNVAPDKIGSYFAKIQCFCFNEQKLEPGERVQMPVSFFVDPAMLEDADTKEVRQITLSYTFFIDREATAKLRKAADGSTS